ncbi:MAG TPA: Ig-like domain-containing protein [Vicinamibacterales bacterium]|nr:Ig-like domain-containing protein [Vicinamibacterales bacterium]
MTPTENARGSLRGFLVTMVTVGVLGAAGSANAAGVPTAVTLLSYPNPSLDGMVVTLTAVVQTFYSLSPAPTGEIVFSTGYYEQTFFQGLQGPYPVSLGVSTVISSPAQVTDLTGGLPLPVVSSTAQFANVPGSLPYPYGVLPFFVSTGIVTACYSGDAIYAGSCASVDQQVTGSDTSLTLTSSANPSLVGNRLQLSAAVTARVGIPSGVVRFADTTTGVALGSQTLDASGRALLPATLLGVGVHLIQATYVPPAGLSGLSYNYFGSTSTLAQFVVAWWP